jgi:hypothetical protein
MEVRFLDARTLVVAYCGIGQTGDSDRVWIFKVAKWSGDRWQSHMRDIASGVACVDIHEEIPVLPGFFIHVGSHPLHWGASDAWFVGTEARGLLDAGMRHGAIERQLSGEKCHVRFLDTCTLVVVYCGTGRSLDGERLWFVNLQRTDGLQASDSH